MLFKKLPLFLLLFLSIESFGITVQGIVQLSGTADHSGVTVSFIPKSPSAVATSTSSLSNGSYSISVVSGLYDIKYSKSGYQEVVLVDQFISADVTLNQLVLSSKPIVHVTGNVSGSWVNTNTYHVDSDITLPAGNELVIQEGTTVKFTGFYRFYVAGKLTAIGSKGKEIVFTSSNTSKARGDWAGIQVSTAVDTTRFTHCQIEYAASKPQETSIINNTGRLVVRNSLVRGSAYGGIHNKDGGFMKIENTEVTDVYMVGILSYSSALGTILDYNKVHHIDLIGLSCQWSVSRVVGNSVYNTGYTALQVYGDFLIERNLLYNNPHGVFVVTGKPIIRNNTIYKNNHGIGFYDSDYWHPSAIITSNIIFQNNGYGIYCEGIYKPEKVEYNLIFNNPSGVANRGPVGLGVPVTNNVNGKPADTYFNIFENPGFFSVDGQNENYLYLLPTSAAIDAGDPLLKDVDNSTVDCGAIPFQKYNQVIAFSELIDKTFGDPDFNLAASSSASLPVTFLSDNTSVAVIVNNTVKITGAGKANITARQVGNTNYKFTEVARELVVHKANQIVTFPAIADRTLGGPAFLLGATTTSTLPIKYVADNDKVSVTSDVATMLKAGRVTIRAIQSGNSNYEADSIERSFCISPAKPTISLGSMNFNKPVLTSSNADGNQWYFNGAVIANATTQNWEATEDGQYTVVSKVDNCTSQISESFVVVITGADARNEEVSLDVYPNPALEQVMINMTGNIQGPKKLEILNSSGQVLLQSSDIFNNEKKINLDGLQPGMYLLRIETNQGVYTRQLIKR